MNITRFPTSKGHHYLRPPDIHPLRIGDRKSLRVSATSGSLTEIFAQIPIDCGAIAQSSKYRERNREERLYMHRGFDPNPPPALLKGVQWSPLSPLSPAPTCLSPDFTSECRVRFSPRNEILTGMTGITASYLICLIIERQSLRPSNCMLARR